MATTTNYGWTTPDDTALVKDGAAAIRTLGSSVDTTTKALNPSTTLGDIEYRSSTANTNTRLAIGTTGQVLTVAGGVPSWATAAGGGKVLQVVSTTYSTETSVTGNTYTDSGLSLSITPSSATSKVLVIIAQSVSGYRPSGGTSVQTKLLRGATDILTPGSAAWFSSDASTMHIAGIHPLTYLDSPATTSATTYKTQFKGGAADIDAKTQFQNNTSTITLLEIGA